MYDFLGGGKNSEIKKYRDASQDVKLSICFLYQFAFGMSHKILQIKRISSRHDRPISKSEVRQYFKEGNRASGWDGSLGYSE